ncbi:selenium cofactor biosynthesis protein YqeC [Anaerocolumna sp. AGMB13020]|uniref:selenium cofactor biosynthesis protein YqeC n=1 Tax=Anaerocolumna sp. AGMB13020 TaxID=3081750 RepID=UPI0029543B19|nr:selenium cofactor biosynthesis protein YqeC [Anaerocolumna sp. AGMB13020]WOO37632.1 selenium cofactor biosynthesis protein YqeC [Anaerocolumna sp. AGMB13020]
MRLTTALDLKQNYRNTRTISIVGGGGKTSTIFTLAYELAGQGKKVLITTTTAMYNPAGIDNPNIFVLGDHVTAEGKLKGISKEEAARIHTGNQYAYILVEADGSKGRPIKAPAEHEPVIPDTTDIMIGVIGMDAFGKKVTEVNVHRPEILCALTNPLNGIVDEEVIFKLVTHSQGLFKNCPVSAKKILLLNKVFDEKTNEVALKVGHTIIRESETIDRIIIGAVREEEPVRELMKGRIV